MRRSARNQWIMVTVLASLSASSTALGMSFGESAGFAAAEAMTSHLKPRATLESSRTQPREARRSLGEDLRVVRNGLDKIDQDSTRLEIELLRMYAFLYNSDPRSFDLDEIRLNSDYLMRQVFEIRLAVRERLLKWHEEGRLKAETIHALRQIFRAGRYLEDTLAELVEDKHLRSIGRHDEKGRALPFSSGVPYVLSADRRPFGFEQFQAGDVLLMRGTSPVSAAIARVTAAVTQFSHLALVHVDSETNKKYVVESLIETGARVVELEKYLEHPTARMVVFRLDDRELAERAARFAFQTVQTSLRNGQRIRYDFTMDFEDSSRLFCSELVSWAYDRASDGKFSMPLYRNRLAAKNRDFLRRITVPDSRQETFAPGDIEMDGRFRLIAEYRDPSMTEKVRTDDVIFDRVFEWIETENRRLDESTWMKTLGRLGHIASGNASLRSMAHGMGIPIDRDVSPQVMSTVIALQSIKDGFRKELDSASRAYRRRVGFPMPPKLLYEKLDHLKAVRPNLLKLLKVSGSTGS